MSSPDCTPPDPAERERVIEAAVDRIGKMPVINAVGIADREAMCRLIDLWELYRGTPDPAEKRCPTCEGTRALKNLVDPDDPTCDSCPNPFHQPVSTAPAGEGESWTLYRFTSFAGRSVATDWQVLPPDRTLEGYDGDTIEGVEVVPLARAEQAERERDAVLAALTEGELSFWRERDEKKEWRARADATQATLDALSRLADEWEARAESAVVLGTDRGTRAYRNATALAASELRKTLDGGDDG